MLSIGWTEMMLVAAIALIVVGPKDLPALLRQVGKFAGQIRRMGNDFKSELNKVAAVDDIKDIKKSFTAPLIDVKKDAQKTFNSIAADGAIKPSGAMSPRDPNSESVVDEIRDAAGLPPSVDAAGEAAKKSVSNAARKAKADTGAAKAAGTATGAAATSKKPARAKASPGKPKAAAAKKTSSAASKAKPAASKPAARRVSRKATAAASTAETKPAKAGKPATKAANGAGVAKKPATRKASARKTAASRKPRTTPTSSNTSSAES